MSYPNPSGQPVALESVVVRLYGAQLRQYADLMNRAAGLVAGHDSDAAHQLGQQLRSAADQLRVAEDHGTATALHQVAQAARYAVPALS